MPIDTGGASNMMRLGKEEELDWLTFTAAEDGTTVQLNKNADSPLLVAVLEYRIGKGAWKDYKWDGLNGTPMVLAKTGDTCQMRAKSFNATFSNDYPNFYQFHIEKKVYCSGNIQSLLDKTCEYQEVPYTAFYRLFHGQSMLSCPDMPAVILSSRAYRQCYAYGSFLSYPIVPKTLDRVGYQSLDSFFRKAGGGTRIEIGFNDSYENSYNIFDGAFESNKRLIEAVVNIPMSLSFYSGVLIDTFYGCSSLQKINANLTDWHEEYRMTIDWVKGVSPTGTFTCPSELPVLFDNDHIPWGWKVDNGKTEVTEEEVLNACYTGGSNLLGVRFNQDFRKCLDAETQTDYTFKGKKYWSVGSSLPNPSINDVYKKKYMGNAFRGWIKIKKIDMSKWNLASLNNLENSFNGCHNAEQIIFPNGELITGIESLPLTFYGCMSLSFIDLSMFDFSNCLAEKMDRTFYNCTSVTTAYARTQEDADKLNASVKESGLKWRFTVKPQ